MTRTDSLVVGTLVVLLALIAGLVGVPSLLSTSASTGTPSPPVTMPASRPYREGMLGHPVSVSPLSARTQADRDLVALVYSGLVRNGPKGTIVPDLAERWSVDPTGATWTFQLRDDATWHDGQPVTAEDVAFTIRVLQDPKYSGPGAGSWNEVTVQPVGMRTVVFTLATPLGGFLQAATQPIAPAHVLAGIPVDQLVDDPSGREPIGSGPFAVTSLDNDTAELVPAVMAHPSASPTVGASSAAPNSLATPARPDRPTRPLPYLAGIEFHFFGDQKSLADAYRAGEVDGASGLTPEETRDLAMLDGSHALDYPGSTLTTVLLNLRPGHPEFADPAVRTALLEAIDRHRHHLEGLRHGGDLGQRPHPAVLVAVRPAGGPAGRLRPGGGDRRTLEGRLDQGRRRLAPAQGQGAPDDRAGQPGQGLQRGRLRGRPHGGARLDGARHRGDPRAARARATWSPAGWPRASSRPRSGMSRSDWTPISIRCWRRARRSPVARTSSGCRIRPSTSCWWPPAGRAR